MKVKQLESIIKQHGRYINSFTDKEPKIEDHVILAIVNGESLIMKTRAQIIDICRKKIVSDRYSGRNIEIQELFVSCSAYDAEKRAYEGALKAHEKRVSLYRSIADPLLRKAELDDDADPIEVSSQLADAAKQHGLYA